MRATSGFTKTVLWIATVTGIGGFDPTIGAAQMARTELHPFTTLTLTDKQFLTGARDSKPVVIAGELRIPRPGTDRLPAVVLIHGSGGLGANLDCWSEELNRIGVATFILDGFTGRGIAERITDKARIEQLAMINDAYRALELLSKHPRMDPARIAIMGFSSGGRVALYSSLERFKRLHGPADVDFAAYVAFYAPCNTTYIDGEDVSDRPIRLFHGASDDSVAVAPCRSYIERLRRGGKDVQLTEYPKTHHNFDNPTFQPPVFVHQAQTGRRCALEEKPVGQFINRQTR